MPIEPPELDDLRYDSIVDDLVRRIPVYAPEWTDHNDSDPGIALIQLFAHLAEQVGYRLNRVPELAHVELLKLLGMRLEPATAATARLALLLDDPTKATARTAPAGTPAKADAGDPPPVFTTDSDHEVTPADVAAVLTSQGPQLHDVLVAPDGTHLEPDELPDTPTATTPWLDLRWDGRAPKPVDLPTEPIVALADPTHHYWWLGLRFNPKPSAGFLATRVTLHVQFDDDEQPTLESIGLCAPDVAVGEDPPTIDWIAYWDDSTNRMEQVRGRIEDTTDALTRSGSISFAVPEHLGAIPAEAWVPLQEPSSVDPLTAARAFSQALGDELGDVSAIEDALSEIGSIYRDHFVAALEGTFSALPPPPELDELLTTIRDELMERFMFAWDLPDVTGIRDFVETELRDVLDTITCNADIEPMYDRLHDLFLGPIQDLIDGGFANLSQAVTNITNAITAIDLGAAAADLHAAARDWVFDELNATGPLTVPFLLRWELADFFRTLAVNAVDAVWGGVISTSVLTGIAEHYRQAALDALDTALDEPPTAALSQLAETYADALAAATEALEEVAGQMAELVDHPLDHRLRDPDRIQGWIRLEVPDQWREDAAPKLRHAGFNVVEITNAETARRQVLGTSNGRPGQQFALPHRNVLTGTVNISVQESVDASEPLVVWGETNDLAAAGPHDRVFDLDREAGVVTFGDGTSGRIPPLVPGAGSVVSSAYRHGGGLGGEIDVGDITKLTGSLPGVRNAVNVVRATGGRDAETLTDLKIRARHDLATRHRAVTAADFEWIATRAPAVRVARAVAVALRRPLAAATGLDDGVVAHGAVSVVVVPDDEGPQPTPTASFLRAVCHWLDDHRLVTTEVHVVPPQFARLTDLRLVLQPEPGYTRAHLRDAIAADLASHLHVLTGGDDGTGFGFGRQIHIADLVARVSRMPGVDRVEDATCAFSRTKSNATPRDGELHLCPEGPGEVRALDLGPEETVSFDPESVVVTTVVAP
jgi:predicted phage baseplate assembly protein